VILPDSFLQVAVNSEADLVSRARRGDDEACEELAKLHRRSAYVLALQLLGNRDDALDVTQDAMLRFFTTLHRFDVSRPVRPWLFQIVRNRVQDLYRRRRVRRHESIDEVDDDSVPVQVIDTSADPEADCAKVFLRRQIWKALHELPSNQKEILVLRDYQDLSYGEIAETLDIPMGTVMSRLHAARKRLREILKEDFVTETR